MKNRQNRTKDNFALFIISSSCLEVEGSVGGEGPLGAVTSPQWVSRTLTSKLYLAKQPLCTPYEFALLACIP